MTTKELPHVTISHAMRDLAKGRISAEDYRRIMAELRESLSDRDYNLAKLAATQR